MKFLFSLFSHLISALFVSSAVFANPVAQEMAVFATGKNFTSLDEQVFPFGWSGNGEQLGLLRALPNEAADERRWKVELIDLVTDKLVIDETILHLDEGGIQAFWTAHGGQVMELFAPHKLVPIKGAKLDPFPILAGQYRGDIYEISITRQRGEEPNFGYTGISNVMVELTRPDDGKTKTVFEKNWPQWYPLAMGSAGYLLNPNGDRAAIFLTNVTRGYEGAPHPRSLIVVGARIGEKF